MLFNYTSPRERIQCHKLFNVSQPPPHHQTPKAPQGGARGNPILNPLSLVHHETLQAPQTVAEEPSPPNSFPSAAPTTIGSMARREKLHHQPLLLPHHQIPRDTTTRNRNPNTPHPSIPHRQTSQCKVAGTIAIHTGSGNP